MKGLIARLKFVRQMKETYYPGAVEVYAKEALLLRQIIARMMKEKIYEKV